jgi:hypothetical protein
MKRSVRDAVGGREARSEGVVGAETVGPGTVGAGHTTGCRVGGLEIGGAGPPDRTSHTPNIPQITRAATADSGSNGTRRSRRAGWQAREPEKQVCRTGRRQCVGEGVGINGFAIEE